MNDFHLANAARPIATAAELSTRALGMTEALYKRVCPGATTSEKARAYLPMSLLEMGREFLDMHGVNTGGMSRMQLTSALLQTRTAAMHTTGDFAALLGNVANKRLRAAYDENVPSYVVWARRGVDAPDFREIKSVALSGAPDLLQVNEHGEFKYGTMRDGAETYSLITYGRIVALSRQAMINDDLRGFGRLVEAYAGSARRLENRLVYAQLTANAALSDGIALFHANHANLGTGGGSALSFDALKAGRTAMRLQKGMQSEELNLAPAYLIVPAALEQVAYQLTSSAYVPATQANVSEFRQGGRTSLTPVVDPLLDANSSTAWYLAASTGQVDTVEYAYLNGADAPVIEQQRDFGVDGISFKARHDFAAKSIDFRGLYKANGA